MTSDLAIRGFLFLFSPFCVILSCKDSCFRKKEGKKMKKLLISLLLTVFLTGCGAGSGFSVSAGKAEPMVKTVKMAVANKKQGRLYIHIKLMRACQKYF